MKNTREIRETTLLELAALVLKQSITEGIKEKGMKEFVDDIACYRAKELVKRNVQVEYCKGVEAFTCEICSDRLYIIKHTDVNSAILYAVDNIGEISIVFNENIVVIGGIQDKEVIWGYNYGETVYKIQLGENAHKKQEFRGIVYSTAEV